MNLHRGGHLHGAPINIEKGEAACWIGSGAAQHFQKENPIGIYL